MGTAGTPQEVAGGTLTFDTNGAMTAATTTSSSFSFTGGATASQAIGFDFTGTTQVATPSITNSLTQDGYAAGRHSGLSISIAMASSRGVFSNGRTRPIAQLAIATFPSEVGLNMVRQQPFRRKRLIGSAHLWRGLIPELPDLSHRAPSSSPTSIWTEEFINLITTERAFSGQFQDHNNRRHIAGNGD